ncbi:MAG: ATP-binding protein [Pseudomonadota bacterium]|jgi:nitrogen fixation/metabolism regulation signal transduction histidine kinase
MKVLLIAAAVLAAILLFLLTTATANTDLFARNYPLLLGLNAAAVVLLLVLVLVQLRALWREHRAKVFGSRLKLRLMLMFALMAVLPGALVYSVAVQFAVKSIESWFDVRVDSALEGGLNLGRTALDYLLEDLADKGRTMALDLTDYGGGLRPGLLNRLREQTGIQSATVLSASGQVVASSSAEVGTLLPELPTPAQLRQVRQGRTYSAVEGDAATGLVLKVLVPLGASSLTAEDRVLQLIQPVPPQLSHSAESVQNVYRDYQQLSLARQGLKRIFALTLTLTLLLALFAAIALAFVLSRRLSAPLSILAEGTRAVAQGDFSPRQALHTHDELGVLTQSFNRMTRQLDEARALAEKNRAEVEAARAYLESVLASLSAGVLAFDAAFRLRAANRGARAILDDELADLEGRTPAEWPRFPGLREAILLGFDDTVEEWQRQIETQSAAGVPQVLLLRGSRLPEASGGGFTVVFDDITQLIAAQRSAAWGEVARRLAHEIKNPLTPIQLSAERLQLKLADKLAGVDREMLERSTQTIVNQVEAMKAMVNDFRDYARMPPPQLAPTDLNALVKEVLALYEASRVRITLAAQDDLPEVLGDATQLRQVIHNLLQNGEDALSEEALPEMRIVTRHEGRFAVLTVTDNGPGFPPQILSRAFEPYVTTKPRGTGLGLAIVKKIVDEHHGSMKISNGSPKGAQVQIKLSLAAEHVTSVTNSPGKKAQGEPLR